MNKNSRSRFNLARKNAKRGQMSTDFEIGKTQKGDGNKYTKGKITITIAKMGSNGVVSQNRDRNMQMKIYQNKGPDKKGNSSATRHESIVSGVPYKAFKNKNYNKKLNANPNIEENSTETTFVKIPKKVTTKNLQ